MSLVWSVIVLLVYFDVQLFIVGLEIKIYYKEYLKFFCLIIQRIVESYVDKRVGSIYGLFVGKKMIIFVDDINMLVINEWGDQIVNEIVR